MILSPGPTLFVPIEALTSRPAGSAGAPTVCDAAETLAETDCRHILAALLASDWVLAGPGGAAARLGIKRSTLQFRMRKLGIERPGNRTNYSSRRRRARRAEDRGRHASPLAPASPLAANPLAPRRARPRPFHHNSHRHHGLAPRRARGAAPARSSLLVSRPCSASPSTPTRIDRC